MGANIPEIDVKRICVVGSGPSGLGCARVLLEYGFEPVIFEQQPFICGQWHYQEPELFDRQRLTSAIYRDLLTNLPCSVMQFSDFPFINHDEEAYIKYKDVELYLFQYTEQHQLQQHLLLNTQVIDIIESNDGFLVKYSIEKNGKCDLPDHLQINLSSKVNRTKRNFIEECENSIVYSEYFDAVCICSGHHIKPYIPLIVGLDEVLENKKSHASTYRYPEQYEDKTVVIIGGGFSGVDIAGELASCCKQVILSAKPGSTFDLSIRRLQQGGKKTCLDYLNKTFVMKPPIKQIINGGIVIFEDESTVIPDHIITATGYDYEFRFLSTEKLQLQYDHRRFLYPLYRQLFNVHYPQGLVSYLAVPFLIVPFPLCEIQTHLVARCLKNEIKLPTTNEMLKEIDDEMSKIGSINRYYHRLNMVEYVQHLFELLQNDNPSNTRTYKFSIDNERRLRKIDKLTNTCIIEQTIQHKA